MQVDTNRSNVCSNNADNLRSLWSWEVYFGIRD